MHFSKLHSDPCFRPLFSSNPASPKLRVQIADYHLRDTFEERPPALIRCMRGHQKRSHNYRMAVRPRQNPDVIKRCGHAIQCVRGPAFVRETNPRRNSRPQSIGDRLAVEKIKEKSRRWRGKKLPLPELLPKQGSGCTFLELRSDPCFCFDVGAVRARRHAGARHHDLARRGGLSNGTNPQPITRVNKPDRQCLHDGPIIGTIHP